MLPPGMAGDLHGNAPDDSPVALLIIDMINAFDFRGADEMLPRALAAARAIARLKERARQAGMPAVYVNDNFGRWRSDFHQILEHVTLNVLLEHLGASTLILTGVAGNFCVLFTAHDAYMRDYRLVVPQDCIASLTQDNDRDALRHMAEVTKADVRPSPEIDLTALAACRRDSPA